MTPSAAAPAAPPAVRVHSAAVVGDLRLETLTSRVFGNTRSLRVLLPDGYDTPENRARRYPVLYLADGQNLFDPATSVFGPSEWRVDETVHDLVARGEIPPMIVVGVDDAGRTARAHEYLPHPDTANARFDPYDPAPQGARYPEFMLEEVMPLINARYRTATGPAFTGIGGSSWGALISAYVVANRPGVFGTALLESPTVAVYDSFILQDLSRARSLPQRVFVGIGTNEDGRPGCDPNASAQPSQFAHNPMLDGARRLDQTLESAGLDSTRLRFVVEPCGTHTHATWARRLPDALTFLYGERRK
ncbi:MAG TPA: alpha/beta hydrolase-fold protein [Gemmatimonadaceae bacterium]|nr:alpha/beta hydrolase-fold protein [Gemmatimonadaceae bacterium]